MIRFSTTRLEKEPIELVGEEPAEFLELVPTELIAVSGPVRYQLHIKAISGGALVEGRIGTELSGICGRCLAEVTQELWNEHICLFIELSDDEEIDLSEELRAELLLELPITLLCSEDCLGLCPECGCDRNRQECSCAPGNSGPSCWDALDNLKL